jgi:hypothetical protein
MSATLEIKKAGLKSVTNVARLLSLHRATIHNAFNKDRELFESYLIQAKEIQNANT